jgi:hypothetical protein
LTVNNIRNRRTRATNVHASPFSATGITDYLKGVSRLRIKTAGHSKAKTTGLHDRRNDDVGVGEVERIGI